jgi:hypothetical protein
MVPDASIAFAALTLVAFNAGGRPPTRPRARQDAYEWMRSILQKNIDLDVLHGEIGHVPGVGILLQHLYDRRLSDRNRSMVVLAGRRRLSARLVCSFLGIDRKTHRQCLRTFEDGGCLRTDFTRH